MKLDSVKKAAVIALRCALCAALASFFFFGGEILVSLRDARDRIGGALGRHLAERHGVVLLVGFDSASPRDTVSLAELLHSDTTRVPGRCGDARRIDLDKRPILRLPVSPLAVQTESSSFTAWFSPCDVMRRQLLFRRRNHDSGFGLVLENNELTVFVADCATNVSATCRYAGAPGRFTHVALVFDGGRASVFQNGRETASLNLVRPYVSSAQIFDYGCETHDPFEGDIDDLAVWSRALPAGEIKSLAESKCGIRRMYAPVFSCAEDAAAAVSGFIAGLYRSIGRLVPPLRNPAQIAKDIPKMTVWPSKNDERVFLRAHEESLHSGCRTPKAAKFRKVDVSFGGATAKLEVALDDVYGRGDSVRPAFVVKDPSHAIFGGCGIVRVYPPELHTALHPDAAYPLPLSGSFVRMFHEDSYKGLYVIEPFDRIGGAWMARGVRDPHFKSALYFYSSPAPCDIPPPGVDPDAAFASVRSLALSDVLFPWSRQEVSARRRACGRNRDAGKFAPLPDAAAENLFKRILAGNPSPMFVTNDLALAVSDTAWESSDPDLIAPDGRVTRPASGAPRPVTLTPVGADGARGAPLRFRVAPLAPDLQTLFLYTGFPIDKHRRSDFVCFRVPAGGGAPEWISGLRSSNGGIKHRGNTSYVKGAKRSFSLEFDEAVQWPGSSREAQHVLLFSGYADATRLRNKVSFDSYRVAASKDVPCGAIEISWSEVFINGEYFGVWETCRRAKDICDPKTYLFKVRARDPNLWLTTETDMTECVSANDPRNDPYRPLKSLFEFTSGVSGEAFASEVGNVFYTDSIVDFCLMLNFTENFDGQVTNQYMGRRTGEDKWFLIPWDYDKTFFDGVPNNLTNRLIEKMFREVPGFKDALSAKWTALRAGPMSDEAVFGRIDADVRLLIPYMSEEYRLLQPLGWDGDFEEAVERLKSVVSARLKVMDAKFRASPESEEPK